MAKIPDALITHIYMRHQGTLSFIIVKQFALPHPGQFLIIYHIINAPIILQAVIQAVLLAFVIPQMCEGEGGKSRLRLTNVEIDWPYTLSQFYSLVT